VWFASALIDLYLFDSFIKTLKNALTYQIGIGSVKFSPGSLILLVFIIWFSFLVSRLIRFALDEDVYPRVHLAKGLPYAASTILHYLILLAGVFLALAAAGIDLTKFTVFLGALGVGVGIGLQNIVENFTSGLILLLERPVKVGDTIQMSHYQGQLRHIGLRSSIVKTGEGAEVIVPNGQLITEEVTNWTLSDSHRRIDINVGAEYGADPENVIKLLEKVGISHPDALPDNPARALFLGFGESSLDFQLRVWTANQNDLLYMKSELTIGVYKALKEAGIEIPFPQRDLHIKNINEEIFKNVNPQK
jgi:potassium efflux system protein